MGVALLCQQRGIAVRQAILLNAATMFWPIWYGSLLSEDWFTNEGSMCTPPSRSWVVTNDPLSEGIPGMICTVSLLVNMYALVGQVF